MKNKMTRSQTRESFLGFRSVYHHELGFSLIEVLLALAILSAVAVIFLGGMPTSSIAAIVNDKQITAEGLAKSQMEYIKRQDYHVDRQYDKLNPLPPGYAIEITAEVLDPRGDTTDNDDGLQKIKIKIIRDAKTVFTLEGYKSFVNRSIF